MHELNAKMDLYEFYKSEGISQEEILKILSLTKKGENIYFYKELTVPNFDFFNSKSEKHFLFSVEYSVPS